MSRSKIPVKPKQSSFNKLVVAVFIGGALLAALLATGFTIIRRQNYAPNNDASNKNAMQIQIHSLSDLDAAMQSIQSIDGNDVKVQELDSVENTIL